jgi:hypothetical protein
MVELNDRFGSRSENRRHEQIFSGFAESGHHAATASSFSPRMTMCSASAGRQRG